MATFGPTSDNGFSSSHTLDRAVVSSATPSTSGTLTKLTARIWLSSAGSCNVKGVVYSNSAGNPSTLLATGDEITLSATSEAAVDLPFSGAEQLSLTASTAYWIGFIGSDPGTPSLTYSRQDGGGATRRANDTYSDGPAATWSETSQGNGPIDCFGTYTEAGAATADTLPALGVG